MARWLRPNREISSGISGGTAKKVTPTEKKLTTVDARINQRREERSGCVMAGIIQALGRGDRGASGPIITCHPDRAKNERAEGSHRGFKNSHQCQTIAEISPLRSFRLRFQLRRDKPSLRSR